MVTPQNPVESFNLFICTVGIVQLHMIQSFWVVAFVCI